MHPVIWNVGQGFQTDRLNDECRTYLLPTETFYIVGQINIFDLTLPFEVGSREFSFYLVDWMKGKLKKPHVWRAVVVRDRNQERGRRSTNQRNLFPQWKLVTIIRDRWMRSLDCQEIKGVTAFSLKALTLLEMSNYVTYETLKSLLAYKTKQKMAVVLQIFHK